ncbi:MAG: RsmD family RNA methyltransferase [Planctomycetota bacterium]
MKPPSRTSAGGVEVDLRIIGGRWRGTRLTYTGDPVTRPMKHRVREAIFNLVGPAVEGKHAIDAFAGTGALGLEALSRGAIGATLIERHVPTAAVIRENIAAVGAEPLAEVLVTSAFLWGKRDLPGFTAQPPWLVFISPPYAFFAEREVEMLALIRAFEQQAPAESLIVVEADERFDFGNLPGGVRSGRHGAGWDVREYAPAVVGLWRG